MESAQVNIGLPEKVRIIDHGSYIHIFQKPHHIVLYYIAITFCVLGIIILTAAFYYIFEAPSQQFFHFSLHGNGSQYYVSKNIILLATILTITTLGGYCVLTKCINTFNVFVSQDVIRVRYRPLPWFKNKNVKASDLSRIYAVLIPGLVEGMVDQYGGYPPDNNMVVAMNDSGVRIKIIDYIDTYEEAVFVAMSIEKYLKTEQT